MADNNKKQTRRLYTVMNNAQMALVAWMAALVAFSILEWPFYLTSDFFNSMTFVVLQMPLYGLVMFGSYAMIVIGYHLYILKDCDVAHKEILNQVDEAKAFLTKKGMNFDAGKNWVCVCVELGL